MTPVRRLLTCLAAGAACLLAAAAPAPAQVDLAWTPGDTVQVAAGATVRVGVRLDTVVAFRTVEITAAYDTSLVTSLGGGPGALFTDSGLFLYDGFEEQPGLWHGFVVVMDGSNHLTGPGEVLWWDIEGKAPGASVVEILQLVVYDEASPPHVIAGTALGSLVVQVTNPLSAAPDAPVTGGKLDLAPNPFNPRTMVRFALDEPGPARISVHDLQGRRVAVLYDGLLPAGETMQAWDGTDDGGHSQPAGVYVFTAETTRGLLRAKGTLVK